MYKKCTKCGNEFPANLENFYRNSGGKFGVTPRCKRCVNEDNRIGYLKRMAENPERVRKLASERSKRYYHKDLEESRRKSRQSAKRCRQDDVKREKINFRKRAGGAGLTPDEWHVIFDSQGRKCAICGSDDPCHKYGWNTDHCHQTGKIRFILCAHCNRGLGAFRDNPATMHKAAEMIENFYLEVKHD